MSAENFRWKQRFSNYQRALTQLNSAVSLNAQRPLSDLEKQGLIQAFEYCHELAWNLMKDFFVYQGNTAIMGSRDATREAFAQGLIEDGETWIQMIASRNLTVHTYNQDTANDIADKIIHCYQPLFIGLQHKMQILYDAH